MILYELIANFFLEHRAHCTTRKQKHKIRIEYKNKIISVIPSSVSLTYWSKPQFILQKNLGTTSAHMNTFSGHSSHCSSPHSKSWAMGSSRQSHHQLGPCPRNPQTQPLHNRETQGDSNGQKRGTLTFFLIKRKIQQETFLAQSEELIFHNVESIRIINTPSVVW